MEWKLHERFFVVALKIPLETFLVEWKRRMLCNGGQGLGALETFLVEWKQGEWEEPAWNIRP